MAERTLLHARSQRRQASAQTRQCSWWEVCCSHSSPHRRHATAQAWRAALAICSSKAVCRDTILPVVLQTSAQSRLSRMQRVSDSRSSSPRQASAQAVQLRAQSKQASIHSTSVEASTAAELGLVWSICWAWVTRRPFYRVHPLGTHCSASRKRVIG